MEQNNNRSKLCAVLLFAGALFCMIIAVAADVSTGENGYWIYFVIDLIAAVAFVMMGIGFLSGGNKQVSVIGAWAAAASYALRLIKILQWVSYEKSFNNIAYLIGNLCVIIALVMLAVCLSSGNKSNASVTGIMLVVGFVLEMVYAIGIYKQYSWYKPSVWVFFFSGNYVMIINIFAYAALIIYAFGVAAKAATPAVQSAVTATTADTENKESTAAAPAVKKAPKATNELDNINRLLEYKTLLDEGILTQEEFDDMKKKLLKS